MDVASMAKLLKDLEQEYNDGQIVLCALKYRKGEKEVSKNGAVLINVDSASMATVARVNAELEEIRNEIKDAKEKIKLLEGWRSPFNE
jgi:hypothetical protein